MYGILIAGKRSFIHDPDHEFIVNGCCFEFRLLGFSVVWFFYFLWFV